MINFGNCFHNLRVDFGMSICIFLITLRPHHVCPLMCILAIWNQIFLCRHPWVLFSEFHGCPQNQILPFQKQRQISVPACFFFFFWLLYKVHHSVKVHLVSPRICSTEMILRKDLLAHFHCRKCLFCWLMCCCVCSLDHDYRLFDAKNRVLPSEILQNWWVKIMI